MHSRNIFLSLLFFLPSFVFAGEIYGTIKKDGVAMVNQEVKITLAGKVIATTKTDKNGFFSTTLQQVGKFKLELTGFDGASFEVFSTNNANGYTLTLVKEADKWLIKKQ